MARDGEVVGVSSSRLSGRGAVVSAQRSRHLLPEGFFRPVEYAARIRYREPPDFYRRLQSLGPMFSALGLTPDYVVRLEVPGRRTCLIRSSFMLLVSFGGRRYLVALAGESEWVRNVRAAHGHVVLRHDGQRYAAHLREVPVEERGEVIRAYIHRPSPRGRPMVRTGEARHYFGIEPDATPSEIEEVAPNYPVFRADRVGSPASPQQPPGTARGLTPARPRQLGHRRNPAPARSPRRPRAWAS